MSLQIHSITKSWNEGFYECFGKDDYGDFFRALSVLKIQGNAPLVHFCNDK